MTTDRLLFKEKETGDIYEGLRNKNTSLTSQVIGMENRGFEYLGPVTHTAYETSLNEMSISDLLELIEIENKHFDCDLRLTIENGKIRRFSCTYMGGD